MSEPPLTTQHLAATIGRAVRDARRRLGMDQAELALVANVATRTVHAIERGKPTVRFDVLTRVLEGVGIDLVMQHRVPPSAEGADR